MRVGSVLLQKTRSALKLPLREQLWFTFLYPLSGFIRLSMLCLPMRVNHRYYGKHYGNYRLSALVSERQRHTAWRIGRICELVSRYTPWESKCLVQAIMAITVLRLYRIPYVLYLGVKPATNSEGMKAHAWVGVGAWIVTGREGHRAFAVVSTFVAPEVFSKTGTSF